MNTILSAQIGDPNNRQISLEHIQENIPPDPNEINITEGGEFLDDAIRMKDQPFEETSLEEDDSSLE
jgi:hypothetical protein